MAATLTEETVATPVRMDVEDGIAIIRLNQPGKPVNVISADLVEAMHAVLARMERGGEGVRAANITSEKKGTWIAGAGIDQFKDFRSPADGDTASREGQK